MLDWMIGGDAAVGDRVESKPLKITTAAGIGGAMVAIAGAIPAVIDVFNGTLDDVQLAAALGLVGAGVLALAISWGADSIARAYASAWVIPKSDTHASRPAVQALAEAVVAQAVQGGQRPVIATNGRKVVVQPFAGLAVHAHGQKQKEYVLAMEFDADEEIRYLIAADDGTAEWIAGDKVQFTTA